MFCVIYVITAFSLLAGNSVQSNPTSDNAMPTQPSACTDEVINKMSRRIDALEASVDTLKARLDSERSFCAEALKKTRKNGIYTLKLRNYEPTFDVYCEHNKYGDNWSVIQRRQDGSVDFFRNWTEYQKGFGDLSGEFFIGLDKLHALTSETPQELLIELEDFNNEIAYAKYDEFAIGGETDDYALNVLESYSGNAGNSMRENVKMKFSTKDRDNDVSPRKCADVCKGAWWYWTCSYSNLNGPYFNYELNDGESIYWYRWKNDTISLKRVQMLIRPKRVENS